MVEKVEKVAEKEVAKKNNIDKNIVLKYFFHYITILLLDTENNYE